MEPYLVKQIFYLVAIVIVMVVAIRIMKKVQDVPAEKDFDMENLPEGLDEVSELEEDELLEELNLDEPQDEPQEEDIKSES